MHAAPGVAPALSEYTSVAAELYDALRGEDPLPGELNFYDRMLGRGRGPHLEIGCGTGRVLLRLLEAGLDVEGVDCSEDMLSICRDKARSRNLSPKLYLQRMQQLDLPHRYEAIIVPLSSMMLLRDAGELRLTFQAFHRHLKEKGRLFFSLFAPPPVLAPSAWHVLGDLVHRDRAIRVSRELSVERSGSVLVESFKFETVADNAVLGIHRIRLSFWDVGEISHLLAACGFSDVQVTANHTGSPPGPDTHVLVFEAAR